MDRESNYAGMIIIAAILVLIGLSLIGTVATDVGNMSNKQQVINETVSISSVHNSTGGIDLDKWLSLAGGCPFNNGNWRLSDTSDCQVTITNAVLGNGTALVANTDYVQNTSSGTGLSACALATGGDITIKNTVKMNASNNVTKWSYTYCQDGYIPTNNNGARAVVGLIIIFFALMIMIVAIVPAMRSGVMEMFNR